MRFFINCIIFGIFLILGQFICSFVDTEYLKLDIMFLLGVIGTGAVRIWEIYYESKEKQNDDEFDNNGLY